MKTILLSISIALFAAASAQETKKPVDSKIDNVTVFLNGAQVSRKATVQIPKGTTDLVFHDVSTAVNPQSIQVTTDFDITVLAVNHQINYIEEQSKREEITKLDTQLKGLKEKQGSETAMLQVFQQEENMLIKNQAIGGSNVLLKAVDLKEAMDFQRARMTEVKNKQLEINQRIVTLNKDITKIQQQLNELNAQNTRASGEIVVTVMAKEAGTAKMGISYVVNNAGWYPSYDLRVTDISKPMYLKYKANVYQNSGEEWKDVKLTISSGDPKESGTKPTLNVWNLDIAQKIPSALDELTVVAYGIKRKSAQPEEKSMMIRGTEPLMAPAAIPKATVSEGQTAFQFEIEQAYNIPSDGKQHTVDVQENTINATYEYFCIPKKDKDVFLTARITNWEELNLLNGDANLYFEGTYLGKAFLDTRNTKDTLEVSLGRDKNILVNRTKLKEFSRNQILGSSKTDERSWEITIRNKKQQPINITIQDQFPTSTNKDIVVDKGNYKEGSLDETTNMITWRLKIDPAKEKKIGFNYSVKSPKSASIVLE
jgi:uncharacterized protein (TIGR02231 family)